MERPHAQDAADSVSAETDAPRRKPERTREEFYYYLIDQATRSQARRTLGLIALSCFVLAFVFPPLASLLLLVGIFAGLGIGWVE